MSMAISKDGSDPPGENSPDAGMSSSSLDEIADRLTAANALTAAIRKLAHSHTEHASIRIVELAIKLEDQLVKLARILNR
jgi:hypothetical protein